ncbi:hypothetical protein AzCIB_1679 [Azoarcus sp. CIB]|uniref:hypothetical protein n=1 Tax=Aromatoleum sp. (strain CIB) TaxID=198107 RepID=UPI00067C9B39|nr:hypothetical protein [Azoarcus sp. CIB]AKU11575.1 hypothetical protein AzCIB_1679 [Azoarcus sp. CIB]
MARRAERLICRLLVGILLFAQLAVAAYACPQWSSTGSGLATSMAGMSSMADPAAMAPASEDSAGATAVADMAPGCAGMDQPDPDNPNLCVEYFHFGQQSDHTQAPTVPAALLVSLYIIPALPAPMTPARPAASPSLLAAAPPPHAILHCCFRI